MLCIFAEVDHNFSVIDSFSHPFFDIDIETSDESKNVHLVKILAIDGRRFTYEIRAAVTQDAIIDMKSLLDSAVFSDLLVEPSAAGFEARESPVRLKKHS